MWNNYKSYIIFGVIILIAIYLLNYFQNKEYRYENNKLDSTITLKIKALVTDSLNKRDSVINSVSNKFQIYDSTLFKIDIKSAVSKAVYLEMLKYRNKQSADELDKELREKLKNEQ